MPLSFLLSKPPDPIGKTLPPHHSISPTGEDEERKGEIVKERERRGTPVLGLADSPEDVLDRRERYDYSREIPQIGVLQCEKEKNNSSTT